MSLRERAEALRQRWVDFNAKVMQRAEAALAELDAEHARRVAADPNDHGGLGALRQGVRARMLALGDKIDGAWEALDGELDALRDEAPAADSEALGELWTALARDHNDRRHALELLWVRVETRLEAELARALRQRIDADPAARQLFFEGIGVQALAHEAALEHRLDEMRYQHALDRLRHPTTHDRAWVVEARRRYWQTYYATRNALDPQRAVDLEQAVQNRLAQQDFGDAPRAQQARSFMAELVEALFHGDHARARAALDTKPHHVDLDDCACALAERQMHDGLAWLLAQVHAAEGIREPLEPWRHERAEALVRRVRSWT